MVLSFILLSFYDNMKKFLFLGLFASFPLLQATEIEDRLVAIVDNQPLTEQDLVQRFQAYQLLSQDYKNHDYAQMRPMILEDACTDALFDQMWAELTHNRPVELSQAQIQSFKDVYQLNEKEHQNIQNLYISSIKKDRLTKHFVHDQIQISQQELLSATKQPQIWEAVNAKWCLDIAFSNQPFSTTEAPKKYRSLQDKKTEQISTYILQALDWRKLNEWQFIESAGEYIAVRITDITLPHLLSSTLKVRLVPLKKGQGAENILKLTHKNDLPATAWDLLSTMDEGTLSKESFFIGEVAYQIELIEKDIPISQSDIQAELISVLRNKKSQELMPQWIAEMKNDHFIKILS